MFLIIVLWTAKEKTNPTICNRLKLKVGTRIELKIGYFMIAHRLNFMTHMGRKVNSHNIRHNDQLKSVIHVPMFLID